MKSKCSWTKRLFKLIQEKSILFVEQASPQQNYSFKNGLVHVSSYFGKEDEILSISGVA